MADRRGWRLAAVLVFAVLAAPQPGRANAPPDLRLKFDQRFKGVKCGADTPAGYYCLEVSGTARSAAAGEVRFSRQVKFDIGRFDEKHPLCLPDETVGVATLPRGTLRFRAPGSVCLADGTAAYSVVVTGGTGVYAGALGAGRITVPPPLTDSTGTELWEIEFF